MSAESERMREKSRARRGSRSKKEDEEEYLGL
jgi:hypothetical protein